MSWNRALVGFLGALATAGPAAAINCPLGGAELPKPRDLAGNAIWQSVQANLTAFFERFDADGGGVGRPPDNYSYSIRIFSNNPGPPVLWERYHTAPNLPLLNSTGVTKVDADTVYRLGSVTKVFTVMAFLVQDGFAHLHDPITKHIPELAALQARSGWDSDPVMNVDWDDVTLESLASQMSGIVRDYGVLGEITRRFNPGLTHSSGFPPLSWSDMAPCGVYPICNRTQFFDGISRIAPSFRPWGTPAYSDIAFQLLAYAVENIAGKPFKQVLTEKVLVPLGLEHTFYDAAPEALGIIPGTVADTLWYGQLGGLNPSGNMYSSAKDLAALGLAIMNSTLLRPALTRRWLRPVAYTPDILAAVGMPFGLRRVPINLKTPHRSVTSFNKAGTTGHHGALISMLPDWDVGFVVLIAGAVSGVNLFGFADFIGDILIAGFDLATRDEARKVYAGTYVAEGGLNSSLTISTDPSKPGLGVMNWISNGTAMLQAAYMMQVVSTTPAFAPSARLYWTGLETVAADGSRNHAFKAAFEDEIYPPIEKPRLFTADCVAWMGQTGVTFAAKALDEFIFHLDPQGKVVGVENAALRAMLKKQS